MTTRRRLRIILPATLITLITLAACSPPEPPPAPPRLVRTLKVGAGDTAMGDSARHYSGELRARVETPLGFRVGGKLTQRLVDVGARVRAGQVLARIDVSDAGLQLAQAEAQRALAEADLNRQRHLRAQNFISQAALDSRETAYKAAAVQATLAKNQTTYATLGATHAGIIIQALAEPGQVVSAGQPVVRLALDGEREVAISLPENEIGKLRNGQAAEIRFPFAGDEAAYSGRVREIAPMADPLTRTFGVRVSLATPPAHALGMSATVRFPTAAASGLAIPLTAVFQQGKQAAVWKVGADNTAILHPIVVRAYTDRHAIVESGLGGGETIVAAGVGLLTAGEKLRLAGAAP